jgi:transposase
VPETIGPYMTSYNRFVRRGNADVREQIMEALAAMHERFFNKIKDCRRIATRYDRLAANDFAFIKLALLRGAVTRL